MRSQPHPGNACKYAYIYVSCAIIFIISLIFLGLISFSLVALFVLPKMSQMELGHVFLNVRAADGRGK